MPSSVTLTDYKLPDEKFRLNSLIDASDSIYFLGCFGFALSLDWLLTVAMGSNCSDIFGLFMSIGLYYLGCSSCSVKLYTRYSSFWL